MITLQPYQDIADQGSASIHALSSITLQQVEMIGQAVQTNNHAWDVVTADDYDGFRSVMVASSVDTDNMKSFFIAGTRQRLELSESDGDNLTTLESFSAVGALSERLLDLIAQQYPAA